LSGKGCQQLELGGGQLDVGASNADFAAQPVELEVADGKAVGRRGLLLRATQDGAHARDQLLRAERLRQVVVGAELEADDLVGLVNAGSEHDDRYIRVAA
jgi:hypothetical protein